MLRGREWKGALKAVADLGFVAWGRAENFIGAPTISMGLQIY